jgi:hypothetical protein
VGRSARGAGKAASPHEAQRAGACRVCGLKEDRIGPRRRGSGWQVVGVYEEDGLSGAEGATSGPGSDRLLKDATACKVNMVAARSVDRFGGSVQDLVGLLPAWLRRLRRLASRSTGAVAVPFGSSTSTYSPRNASASADARSAWRWVFFPCRQKMPGSSKPNVSRVRFHDLREGAASAAYRR